IGTGFEIGKLAWHRAHGDQRSAFDFCLGELVRLADVDQMKFFSGIQTPFDFLGIDFEARSHQLIIREASQKGTATRTFSVRRSGPAGPSCYRSGKDAALRAMARPPGAAGAD